VNVEPARADVPPEAVADLLWSTDPVLNRYMFRTMPTLHRILAAVWPAEHGMLCHRQALVVTSENRIRGLLVGHTSQDWPVHFEASLTVQAQNLAEDEAQHLNAAIYWMDRLFPTPRDGSYYVLELAVSEKAQGVGLAKRLLEAAIGQASQAGCTAICLDVAADNPAVNFYKHLGFKVEIETRVPFLAETQGIGTHFHMVRPLSQAV
jgi:ribosomal protein S18 acetylase RimI-like enzyme